MLQAIKGMQAATGSNLLPSSRSAAAPARSFEDVQAQVLGIVASLTGAEVAPDQPLASQGLDSLAAMELRQKLQVHSLTSL